MIQLPDFLTEKIDDLVDFVKTKKYVALTCIILIVFAVCAFLIFSVHSCSIEPRKVEKIDRTPKVMENFTPDQSIIKPDGPEMPDGYALSRNPKPQWSEEEIEKHFTSPNAENLEDLKKSNDTLIDEVLGAAP